MAPSEMTEDVFPKAADNNKTVDTNRAHWETEDILAAILVAIFMSALGLVLTIFSPFGLLTVSMTILRGRTTSQGWRIFAQLMQWVAYLFIVGLSVIILYMLAQEMTLSQFIHDWKYSYSKDEAYFTLAALITIGFVNIVFFWTPIIQSIILFRRNRKKIA
ncbi:MAG: hypothetical protein ACD_43C00221G0004 [uncultured bacterium]|nr:MAG: hypothetical protein ACD_43C00221G0004 [uncultured bacterium]